jgi:hypothetical protein
MLGIEQPTETRLTQRESSDHAARWLVVRAGVDPATSGFSDRRSAN